MQNINFQRNKVLCFIRAHTLKNRKPKATCVGSILGFPVDKLSYFHDKCPTLRSKTKMTKKYFEAKTLFKEVTNLP